MSINLSTFLAICAGSLLAVVAETSSVRGVPFDLGEEIEEQDLLIDGDPATPLQRMLLDGDVFDDVDHFENSMLEESHRALMIDDCVETHGVDYFDIVVSIQPQTAPTDCQVADQIVLGHDINRMLWDYGVGESGEDDGAVFVAGVCPKPASSRRRQLFARAPMPGGFIYPGIGGCREFCNPDDYDKRFLMSGIDNIDDPIRQRELTSAWFTNTFKPQMETRLKDAIENELVPLHQGCLGVNPIIDVDVTGVSLSDLEAPCSNHDSDVEFLKTFNLAQILLNPAHASCGTCTKLDFNTKQDGIPTERGNWIKWNYNKEHGVKITAWSKTGYVPDHRVRIFDTSRPGGGDPDLGSPNENCPGGGPGKGYGGAPGADGENCNPVGMALVIQESNKERPDDNWKGGTIRFEFKEPVLFSDIGVMDIDEVDQRIRFFFSNGSKKTYTYRGLGSNSVQRVIANQYDVVRVDVIFPSSGAITEINFCPECGR